MQYPIIDILDNDSQLSKNLIEVSYKFAMKNPRLLKVVDTLMDYFDEMDEIECQLEENFVHDCVDNFISTFILRLNHKFESVKHQLLRSKKLKAGFKFNKPSPFKPKKRCLNKK